MNYEKDLEIDDQALDFECLDQAVRFMRYAKHSAEMERILDEAKQELDIVKAETDKDIRESPSAIWFRKSYR